MKLKEKTAVVTGASTGIGRAISLELAKEGVRVILVARRKDELFKTKDLINDLGGVADVVIFDLSNIQGVDTFINSITETTKKMDIIVNVAGIWHGTNEVFAGRDFEQFSRKVILDTFNVGLITPALIVHGLIPIIPKGGSVINISGTFENGAKGWLPYFVSKRGLEDFTLGLSQEFADKGINVNCISPSDTATDEYKKYFPEDAVDANAPDDVAREVVKLILSDETGKFVVVKKGISVLQGFHK